MGDINNPKRNSEGYSDPTAFQAMNNVDQQKRVTDLIKVLLYIIDKSGFELTERISLRDKRTGKDYK